MINPQVKQMSIKSKSSQQGSVLLVSLMLLILVTLLTFSMTDDVNIQQKVIGNTRDHMLALQVAEQAVLEAEANISSLAYTANGGTAGLYDATVTCPSGEACAEKVFHADLFDDSNWVKSTPAVTGIPCRTGATLAECSLKGRYIIINEGKINLNLTGSDELIAQTNQYADQQTGAVPEVFKFKIYAQGTGNNPENKRVIITYFAVAASSLSAGS